MRCVKSVAYNSRPARKSQDKYGLRKPKANYRSKLDTKLFERNILGIISFSSFFENESNQ